MTRTTRIAHRSGHPAFVVPARVIDAGLLTLHARAGRPVASLRSATDERITRQVEPDRSVLLARTRPLPERMPQEGVPATVATTGTGHRSPAWTGGVLSLHVVADRHLDRSWDRANLTGARA